MDTRENKEKNNTHTHWDDKSSLTFVMEVEKLLDEVGVLVLLLLRALQTGSAPIHALAAHVRDVLLDQLRDGNQPVRVLGVEPEHARKVFVLIGRRSGEINNQQRAQPTNS